MPDDGSSGSRPQRRRRIDGRATYDDGKDNKTCPNGMRARFETTHGDRTRCQVRVWCVCDESKGADNHNPFWLGHWRSTQVATPPTTTFTRTWARLYKLAVSANAEGKGAASAAKPESTMPSNSAL